VSLLVCIANYGDSQLEYLERQVRTLRGYRRDLHIVVDSTVPLPGLEVDEVRLFRPAIGERLPFQHRRLFAERRDDFAGFLYTENDIDIEEKVIERIESLTRELPDDWIVGPFRFERRDGEKLLIDAHPHWPVLHTGLFSVAGLELWSPANLHAGSYFLTSRQLRRALSSGRYLVRPHFGPYRMLEQGASDVYTQCDFRRKVLPFDVETVLVHHMPDKYVRLGGIWEQPGPHSVSSLKEELRRCAGNPALPTMSGPGLRGRLGAAGTGAMHRLRQVFTPS
jgi:hypothetical protein